jgi:hypothetical protein
MSNLPNMIGCLMDTSPKRTERTNRRLQVEDRA